MGGRETRSGEMGREGEGAVEKEEETGRSQAQAALPLPRTRLPSLLGLHPVSG